MSKVELRGYLDLSKPEKCIELYESAHGKDKTFNEDITELANQWKLLSDIDKKSKFDKLLIKFQNRRSKLYVLEDARTIPTIAIELTRTANNAYIQKEFVDAIEYSVI